MPELLDKGNLEFLLGDYCAGKAMKMHDPILLARVQDQRRGLSVQMMALDKHGLESKLPNGECLVSKKIDGEFTVLVLNDTEVFTVNPYGTVRVGAPFMQEAADLLQKAGIKQAMICGELHVKLPGDKRCRVHDVITHARAPQTQAELDALSFAAFDIMELEGQAPDGLYAHNFEQLQKWFEKGVRVFPVAFKKCKSNKEVQALFAEWVEQDDLEGLVVRSEAFGLYKIKPRHNLDVAVVGFTDSTGERAGMLHDLLVAVMRPDGTFQIACKVGGGFSDEERRQLLSDLKDKEVESQFVEVNSDGVAYRMIRPELVVEISFLDLVSHSTGGTVDRMVLNFDAEESLWSGVRRMPLASVIAPQFVRIRDDKRAHPDDVRIKQLADRVEIALADRNADDLALPPSKLLQREVFTKAAKGKTMVRKLLLWKTNKESESYDFPAYVLYYTDFSPNRKAPLSNEIRVSNSLEQIEALYAQFRDKYVLNGWHAVEAQKIPGA